LQTEISNRIVGTDLFRGTDYSTVYLIHAARGREVLIAVLDDDAGAIRSGGIDCAKLKAAVRLPSVSDASLTK
jgi:hypothetical protein